MAAEKIRAPPPRRSKSPQIQHRGAEDAVAVSDHEDDQSESDDEGSEVEEQSDSSQDEDGESNSSSDSLDSQASRKRRRISLDDDDDTPSIVSKISVPSRIKSKAPLPPQPPPPAQVSAIPDGGRISVAIDSNTSFASLDVKPWLVASLKNMAIRSPTPIQKQCIPEILKGRDCIGGSRTGSGKTVAFAVPILQKWAEDPFGIFALVLTPTRYFTFSIIFVQKAKVQH